MMKSLHRIGSFLVLAVFLLGTTGLSVFHHICSLSHEDTVMVYPGFVTDPGLSCSSDDPVEAACCCKADVRHDCCGESFAALPCCKSIASFIRLEILTLRVEKLYLPVLEAVAVVASETDDRLHADDLLFFRPGIFIMHPPPRYGRMLVHYLHQVKIPALPGLA
jgi:hypothetical protein